MVSGSEKKALEVVDDEGGETTSQKVSRKLGVDTGYARLLCMNLAHKDYVDLKQSGLFKITYKGKMTLGKVSGDGRKGTSRQGGFKRLDQEHLGWDVLRNSRGGRNTSPTFHKPGQEKVAWATAKVDRSGRHHSRTKGGIPVGKLLTQTSYPCGFCNGKGEKPKGVKCPVCRGAGEVAIAPPAVVCAYCKGRGEDKPRSNITCTVCGGKGFVPVKEPIEGCSRCRGKGVEANNKLPCLGCKGKGVISKKVPRKETALAKTGFHRQTKFQMEQKEKNLGRATKRQRNPMASEIEVLKVYKKATRTGKALSVGSYTKMSPAYLAMMVRSLAENGFLMSVAPRRYEITGKGIEFLAGKKIC